MAIRRKTLGYRYISNKTDADFYVESDFVNEKIYLTDPDDSAAPDIFDEFAAAIVRATADMRKYT